MKFEQFKQSLNVSVNVRKKLAVPLETKNSYLCSYFSLKVNTIFETVFNAA